MSVAGDNEYDSGSGAGRAWASTRAEFEQLDRLVDQRDVCATISVWLTLFRGPRDGIFGIANRWGAVIHGGGLKDLAAGEAFWIAAGCRPGLSPVPEFVRGFVEGAIEFRRADDRGD